MGNALKLQENAQGVLLHEQELICEHDALGIRVAELSPNKSRNSELPRGIRGVIVSSVDEVSRGKEAGLCYGDIIQQVNRRPVSSIPEFRRALRKYQGEPLMLRVWRKDNVATPVIAAGEVQ